jgi:hypothetical protein
VAALEAAAMLALLESAITKTKKDACCTISFLERVIWVWNNWNQVSVQLLFISEARITRGCPGGVVQSRCRPEPRLCA